MRRPFELLPPQRSSPVPLLVHVPHSSVFIPADVRSTFVLNDDELEAELLAMTDRYTDELFAGAVEAGGRMFVNRQSRLVTDPERFPEDAAEPMASKGMGAVYTLTSGGERLRSELFTTAEREEVISLHFAPYSVAVEEQVSSMLTRFGRCLIVDVHSFPSKPLPYEDAGLRRPAFCFGYEEFHVPHDVLVRCKEMAKVAGHTTAHNEPFAGGYVPLRYYRQDSRVRSMMIEVRRDLYMDESTGEKSPGFKAVRELADGMMKSAAKLV